MLSSGTFRETREKLASTDEAVTKKRLVKTVTEREDLMCLQRIVRNSESTILTCSNEL
jgi:hypothetical protein